MFAGVVSWGRQGSLPAPPQQLGEALLARLMPLHTPDLTGVAAPEGAVLTQALNWNTPQSQHETVPAVCPHTGNLLVSWLRLDNREDLAAALGIDADEAAGMTDPEYVLAAYRRWGTDTARHLEGDFAFALLEPGTRRLYLARDPIGIRPLFLASGDGFLAFATTQAAFLAVPGLDVTPSRKWLTFYLAYASFYTPGLTALTDVVEVLPAHQVTAVDGQVRTHRYFEFRDDPPWSRARHQHHVEAYLRQFERAVGVRMRSAYPLGSENSGGLDSASIIGVLKRLAPDGQVVHTFGMPEFVEDEESMHAAVAGTGFPVHVYPFRSDRARLESAVRITPMLGHPPEVGNSHYWRVFRTEGARHGIRTLLSGHGGDDSVTMIGGEYVLREMALRHKYRMLTREVPGSNPLQRAVRAVRFTAAQRRRPMYHPDLRASMLASLDALPLTESAVQDFGLRDAVLDASRFSAPYRSINEFILHNRLPGPQVRRVAESCQASFPDKVEYRYPMLDVRLVQTYLSTPAIEKYALGSQRHLHRRAMAGLVPEPIRTRPYKDMGELVGLPAPDLQEPARDLRGTLLDGIVDEQAVRDMVEETGPASVSGFAWRLAVVLNQDTLPIGGT